MGDLLLKPEEFRPIEGEVGTTEKAGTGVLPSQGLREAIRNGEIRSSEPIESSQIQPASLDLRLGDTAYRVRASFLAGRDRTVWERLQDLTLHALPLTDGAVLECNCVYIIPLQEFVNFRRRTSGHANPKSSTGRLDVFARVITDRGTQFDAVEERYSGPLYVEVAPRTFSIRVRTGSRLVQLRVRRGSPPTSEAFHKKLQDIHAVVSGDPSVSEQGVPFTVDVTGAGPNSIIGYKAKKFSGLIDVDNIGAYDPREFWDPLFARPGRGLVLDPEDFYILASRETVSVPPDHAAEMVAYDTLVGEFRVHYAGFFDPGFGHAETNGAGTRAVLEVRSHEVPFLIEDGQIVGSLAYEKLAQRPDALYGAQTGSYQRQGLALAKQFKPWI